MCACYKDYPSLEQVAEEVWESDLSQSFGASVQDVIDSALPLTVKIDEDDHNYIYLNITQQNYPRERS